MRVLHLLPDLSSGGGQHLVLGLIKNADPRRVRLDVAYLDSPDDLVDAYREAGIVPFCVGNRSDRLLAIRRLRRYVSNCGHQVIHVHSGPDRVIGQSVALSLGLPVVGHLHSPWDHRGNLAPETASLARRVSCEIKGRLRDWIERRTVLVYVSAGKQVTEFHESRSHTGIVTAVNGVEVASLPDRRGGDAWLSLRSSMRVDADDFVMTCVGRLAEGKGQDHLISMMPRLPGVLVLVGDGPQRTHLEQLAVDCSVADRVRFLGHRSDVARVLLASDVFVFASASEGLPLAVLEAMSTALPVVAITLPSLREVIAPGRNGYLINPHDTDGFRGAVEELCYDDQLRARMGMESRRIVASQFNVRSTQHTIEDVYEQVVQQPQLSPRTIPL